jgi:hypothetical protein
MVGMSFAPGPSLCASQPSLPTPSLYASLPSLPWDPLDVFVAAGGDKHDLSG